MNVIERLHSATARQQPIMFDSEEACILLDNITYLEGVIKQKDREIHKLENEGLRFAKEQTGLLLQAALAGTIKQPETK